ncbi:MAG TPA: hypothetical protein VF607_02185 [Verrucomicrobiae bacterium]
MAFASHPDEAIEARANAHMHRGMALLAAEHPPAQASAHWHAAIHEFDESLTWRQKLPWADNPWYRYGMIAGHLNRGEAFTRLRLTAPALAAFDAGIELLQSLPLQDHPAFARRWIIAWINRGLAELLPGTPEAATRAEANFRAAIEAAEQGLAHHPGLEANLLAAAWMNYSQALLAGTAPALTQVQSAARQALNITRQNERQDLVAADIALRAWHVLCRALTGEIETTLDRARTEALLGEVTDAMEAGLSLGYHWQTQYSQTLADIHTELFQFGCEVYLRYQPHFLVEFIEEQLPVVSPTLVPSWRQMALESIWHALGRSHQRCLAAWHTPDFAAALKLFSELRQSGGQLAAIPGQTQPS